jgi:hypothetical protein
MELLIQPADLRAAAELLTRCGATLEDAGLTFARRAQADQPEVGTRAAAATGRAMAATDNAVQVLATDIQRLADALDELARHYPMVDDTAVRRR